MSYKTFLKGVWAHCHILPLYMCTLSIGDQGHRNKIWNMLHNHMSMLFYIQASYCMSSPWIHSVWHGIVALIFKIPVQDVYSVYSCSYMQEQLVAPVQMWLNCSICSPWPCLRRTLLHPHYCPLHLHLHHPSQSLGLWRRTFLRILLHLLCPCMPYIQQRGQGHPAVNQSQLQLWHPSWIFSPHRHDCLGAHGCKIYK